MVTHLTSEEQVSINRVKDRGSGSCTDSNSLDEIIRVLSLGYPHY